MLSFKEWLINEESLIKSYKSTNPKNPNQHFIVLYGNTIPIKDRLKDLGFKYFKGTWSIGDYKFTDALKNELIGLGVDFSGLEAEKKPILSPEIKKPSEESSDEFLQKMKDNLENALEKGGEDAKLSNLINNIESMIEKVANSTDEAAKQSFIRNFLVFSSKFHAYSLANQILIWVQTGGHAQHVSSASNWVKLGRTVKDWSKGIVIFAPNFKNIEREVKNPQTGEISKEKTQLKYFKAVKVYDVTATEPIPGNDAVFEPIGRKDWSKDSNDDNEEISLLVNALANWISERDIDVNYQELSDELGGYSAGGKIVINNKFKGMNLFSTLVHETAHELLHWLEDKNKDKDSSRKEKEIDAETTAFIVCHHFGFESQDTPNYLALWQAKGEEIRNRRKNIIEASKLIIQGIEKTVPSMNINVEERINYLFLQS